MNNGTFNARSVAEALSKFDGQVFVYTPFGYFHETDTSRISASSFPERHPNVKVVQYTPRIVWIDPSFTTEPGADCPAFTNRNENE